MPRRAKSSPNEPGKARLEKAALELFGEHGYDATSISAIGARAGITKSVLYHYFPSKADLYEAVCSQQTADLIEAVAASAGKDRRRTELRVGLTAYFQFLQQRPLAWRLLLRDRPAEPRLGQVQARLEQQRAAALTELLASPGKKAAEAEHRDLVAAGIRAFAAWWYDHRDVEIETVVEAAAAFAKVGAKL